MIARRHIFAGLGLALLAVFILLPFVQVAHLSVLSTLGTPDAPLGTYTLANYRNIFASDALTSSLVNSVTYVTLNVALTLLVALPAAYAISRYPIPGKRLFFITLLTFRVTPPVVLSLPVFILFSQLNLINTPVGIAVVHCVFNVPIAIWILESFISAVPREYDETSKLDGYSTTRFFIRHLIPVIAPGIGVTMFFCFVFSWVEVVFARTLTVTDGKPITMAISNLFGFQTDVGLVMAMTIFSLLPGLVMIYFVRHHIARGFVVRA